MKLQVAIKNATDLTNVELATMINKSDVSDPYVYVTGAAKALQTPHVNNNLSPVWDFTGSCEWDGSNDLTFTVYDKNVGLDKAMGKATLTKDLVKTGFSGVLKLDTQGTLEVEVGLEMPNLSTMPTPVDLTPLLQHEILMWKVPIKSGLLLGSIDLAFVLYFFFAPSPLALVSKLGMVGVMLGFIVKFSGRHPDPSTASIISVDSIQYCAELAVKLIKQGIWMAEYVVSWESQSDTVKVLICLYVIGVVSGWFSVFVLAFTLINLAFIVPVQLQARKKLIDTKIEPELNKLRAQKDKLIAMIPKYWDIPTAPKD